MSKKKAFSGNTMTLKDFHGGSIPSDLPLPSAPGVFVRSMDDRPNSWGGSIGRPDHRTRPSSSPATRHFNDKTPFLSQTAQIGRNFDEDERKPLDGVSAPRRTVSDESFHLTSRVELKPERTSSERVVGSASVLHNVSSYSGKVSDRVQGGMSSQNIVVNGGQSVGGSHLNAWTARKELMLGVNEPVQSAWSGVTSVTKLANASALEKVSSGRWQTKLSIHHQPDVEIIEHLETEKVAGFRAYQVAGGREYSDFTLSKNMEKSLAIDNMIQGGRKDVFDHERNMENSLAIDNMIQGGRKDVFDHERSRAYSYSESKETNPSIHGEWVQLGHANRRFGGSELQQVDSSEALECHKGKLLLRTKPLETSEPRVIDHKQPRDFAHGHVTSSNTSHGKANATKPVLPSVEGDTQVVERPKLNLKPRSQPLEQQEGNIERNILFGGARPREVVLKERGIDVAVMSNNNLHQQSDRTNHNVSKTERVPEHSSPTHQGERTGNLPLDQKTGKKPERKDQQADSERADMQKRNWHNENWRNSRETERRQKQQQQQVQQERQPSPETWRKPVEEPKAASSDAIGARYGKTASAAELAQAFSRSFSDPKTADQYSSQRGGLPGKTQIPFSRLMGPKPRPQINGY